MQVKVILFFMLFGLSSAALAFAKDQASSTIHVAANPTISPYVISYNDSGIQIEIVKAALRDQKINDIKVHYMANQRSDSSLVQGSIDIALNYTGNLIAGVYKSESVISYENVVVSLKRKNFTIDSVYQLATKSVLAFQNAPAFLPQEFGNNLHSLGGYEEVLNQQAQINHLMAGWVDTIIIDRRIFFYYLKEYQKNHTTQDYVIHTIFPFSEMPAYFNDDGLRSRFDQGLANIIQSGEYRTIMLNLDKQYTQHDFTRF